MPLTNHRYRVRFAENRADIEATLRLRQRVFFGTDGLHDQDRFDDICTHVLVEENESGVLVGCYRLLSLISGGQINDSYSAQFYDLATLRDFDGALVEIGRFCLNPDYQDSMIVRMAWAELTRYVDDNAVEMLFGCSSFQGVNPAPYRLAFEVLKRRHLAPQRFHVGAKSTNIIHFTGNHVEDLDRRRALQEMPPLLRSYLQMGGWVSDHAVIDPEMNTLHVFTGLEIAAIPAARKRLLRALVK